MDVVFVIAAFLLLPTDGEPARASSQLVYYEQDKCIEAIAEFKNDDHIPLVIPEDQTYCIPTLN